MTTIIDHGLSGPWTEITAWKRAHKKIFKHFLKVFSQCWHSWGPFLDRDWSSVGDSLTPLWINFFGFQIADTQKSVFKNTTCMALLHVREKCCQFETFLNMSIFVIFPSKSAIANFANEWFFLRMNNFVVFDLGMTCKSFITKAALIYGFNFRLI